MMKSTPVEAPKREQGVFEQPLLTARVQNTIDQWDKENVFDPQLGPQTLARWLNSTSWAPYVVIGSMFILAFVVVLGLLALLKPPLALSKDESERSWIKISLWSFLLAALCAGVAFAVFLLERTTVKPPMIQ